MKRNKICIKCGNSFWGEANELTCYKCSARPSKKIPVSGSLPDKDFKDKMDAVRSYLLEHKGASVQDVIDNAGVSRDFLRELRRSNFFVNSGKAGSKTKYPCAKCGKPINAGVYCRDCLEVLRKEAKAQGERRDALKKFSAEEKIEVQRDKVILVIDSDELNLKTMKFILEKGISEYSVATANSLIGAINILHGLKVKLIILDDAVTLNYDGLRILKGIRDENLFKYTPVIMTTAQAQKNKITRALALGASDYLNRPFNPRDLVERVKRDLLGKNLRAKSYTIFKILLIDDNFFDAKIERETLSRNIPCEITFAPSGTEGIWILDENFDFDLILVNLSMSFMNGMEVLAFIRRSANLVNIPVIMMTHEKNSIGNTNSLIRGYIQKPAFDSEGLALIKSTLMKKKKGG